jgi:hypothetical protein
VFLCHGVSVGLAWLLSLGSFSDQTVVFFSSMDGSDELLFFPRTRSFSLHPFSQNYILVTDDHSWVCQLTDLCGPWY